MIILIYLIAFVSHTFLEIVRLGGTARDASSSSANNIPVEYVPSIAPFPAIQSNESTATTTRKHKNWSNGTKVVACKACRAAKKKCTHNGNNNNNRNNQNTTAEKKEEKKEEKCKPAPKDSSNGDEKKQAVATSLSFNTHDMKENESNNSRSSSGSEFSLTTTDQQKKKKKEKTQVPRQRLSKSGLTPAEIHNGKPWDCECGEHLPGDRARCGKCKKWKGGVRPPNQTTTIATKPKAEKKKKKVVTMPHPLPTVNDIYKNVSDKSADDFTMDGALILASLGSGSYYNDTNRPAVERCLGDIVSAVTSHVEATQAEMKKKTTKGTKKRGRPRKDSGGATATRKGGKSDGTVTVKRKRGRPKKVVAEQPQIQRVVSKESDDSNNGSITIKPDRPKNESAATSASANEQSHMMIDMADLKLSAPNLEDEKEKTKRRKTNPEEVVEATKIVACIVTLAEAAASGCSKCRDELATGEKTRREHSDHCPRKRRSSSSSSSSSGQSSKSTSSSTSTRSAIRSAVV